MRLFIIFISILFLSKANIIWASEINNQAQDLSNSLNNALLNGTNSDQSIRFLPNYSTNPKEANYGPDDLITKPNQEFSNDPTRNLINESHLNRPNITVKKDEQFLQNSFNIQDKDNQDLVNINSSYNDCHEENIVKNSNNTELRTCNITNEITNPTCTIGRIIEFKENYKYQCNKPREHIEKICNKSLSLTCEKIKNCPHNNFKLISAPSNVTWNYNGNLLEITLVPTRRGYNYPGFSCDVTAATISFNIDDINDIEIFTGSYIYGVGINRLKLNNYYLVAASSMVNPIIDNSSLPWTYYDGRTISKLPGEAKCSYQRMEVNSQINSKQSLKNGTNLLNLWLQTRSDLSGESNFIVRFQIKIKQHSCCDNWRQEWQENCS